MRSEVSLRRPIGGIGFGQPLEKKAVFLALNWSSLSLVAEYFTQLPFFNFLLFCLLLVLMNQGVIWQGKLNPIHNCSNVRNLPSSFITPFFDYFVKELQKHL